MAGFYVISIWIRRVTTFLFVGTKWKENEFVEIVLFYKTREKITLLKMGELSKM